MKVPSIYRRLVKNPEVLDMLDWQFDFVVCEPHLLASDWSILLSNELIVLAEDASGGAYTILDNIDPDKSSVIFLSSEGQAGKVAANLTEFLAVMVALPYWLDLLKFSAGGELEEMRKAVRFLEAEVTEDEPEMLIKRQLVADTLELPLLKDPVQVLFSSVNSGITVEIKASDGSPYESLFNTFSVSDNMSWQL